MTTTSQAGVILRHLRTFAAADHTGGPTDRQHLEQLAARHGGRAIPAAVKQAVGRQLAELLTPLREAVVPPASEPQRQHPFSS